MAGNDDWSLYPYTPVKGAPIAFAILLAILASALFYQSFFRFRWQKFGFTMTWASSVWIAGFVCRAISVYNVQSVKIFIAQYVLILFAPPLYAAAEYFILGRMLAYFPYHTPLHPGRVFTTFALLSAAVESLTASGAANSASAGNDASARQRGLACLKAGLLLQCVVEVSFFSLVALLHHRCQKAGTLPRRVQPVFYILYTTSLMMLLRCIIRAIEGFEASSCKPGDSCGYISTHEWPLWVFEVANISLFVILLAVFHPGNYLPNTSKVYLDPIDGKTERLGPGFGRADSRPLLVTIIDPFNLINILTGKGTDIKKFWEEQHPVYGRSDVEAKL